MSAKPQPQCCCPAGITLLFQKRERRRTLALYTLARLAQCYYNSQKQQGRWHAWGSNWQYGDALLFAVSSAQVSCLVCRHESLAQAFLKVADVVLTGPLGTSSPCFACLSMLSQQSQGVPALPSLWKGMSGHWAACFVSTAGKGSADAVFTALISMSMAPAPCLCNISNGMFRLLRSALPC